MSRFLYWLTFGVLAALLLARPLFSQTIPVSGHMGDASQGAPPGMSVKFELYNCGANTPKIVGSFSIVKQNFTLTPDTTGLLTGTIIPNDIISCGGALSTTRYNVTTLLDGIPQAPAACYFVQQSLGTFNLDTASPCTSISPPQPPTPPTDGAFDNLMVSGVLSGGSGVFGGSMQVHELLLDFTPLACATNAFMVGYNADLTVRCSTVSYSQLTGSAPIWNQDTSGNAASATLAATATHVPYSGLTGSVPTWNQSTTGQAATALALAATPSQCSGGTPYSSGIMANGNANCLAAPTGTVTAVSVANANGVSGSSSGGATPSLTIALGDITPTSVAPTGTKFPLSSGTLSNVDWVGELTLVGGTATYSFVSVPALTNRPECFIHDHTTPANDHTNTYVVTATTLTVTSVGTTDVIGYTCFGRI